MLRPTLVGIVNMTEDSFSDGGEFLSTEGALTHARQLISDGANMVELGPSSSHPDSRDVTAGEEIRRIEPVCEALRAEGISVAVDSFLGETQRWCIGKKISMINDIQAFCNRDIWPDLAGSDCQLVAMHSVQRQGRASRVETDATSIVDELCLFLEGRLAELESAGVARDRVLVDPGMGYFLGSNSAASFEVLRNLDLIKARLGARLYISVSRKSFLGSLTGRPVDRRASATLAAEMFAVQSGADCVRTHDPGALFDAIAIMNELSAGAV